MRRNQPESVVAESFGNGADDLEALGMSAIAKLERENAQLRDELALAELVIACQKKLAALLDHPARESSTAPS